MPHGSPVLALEVLEHPQFGVPPQDGDGAERPPRVVRLVFLDHRQAIRARPVPRGSRDRPFRGARAGVVRLDDIVVTDERLREALHLGRGLGRRRGLLPGTGGEGRHRGPSEEDV